LSGTLVIRNRGEKIELNHLTVTGRS